MDITTDLAKRNEDLKVMQLLYTGPSSEKLAFPLS